MKKMIQTVDQERSDIPAVNQVHLRQCTLYHFHHLFLPEIVQPKLQCVDSLHIIEIANGI
jgi:hypothetical protein